VQEDIVKQQKYDLEGFENSLREDLEDVRRYKDSMKAARKESLSYRLLKARDEKAMDSGIVSQQAKVDAEQRRIEESDREDVANHRQGVLDARRESIAYRNAFEKLDKNRLKIENQCLKNVEAQERQRRDEEWAAVKVCQNNKRDEDLKELAEKLVSEKAQREVELHRHYQQLACMHEEFAWKHSNRVDLQKEEEESKANRRESTSVRLDSWRKGRLHDEMMKAKKSIEDEEEALSREQDREDLADAKAALLREERRSKVQEGFY